MNAIITGASKGIGFAIAEIFAKNNINLVICARNKTDLQTAHDKLKEINSNILILSIKADMAIEDDINKLVAIVNKEWSKIDILVNNAGIYIPGEVHNEEDGILEKLLAVNLMGPYKLTRAIVPTMIQQNAGYIFNINSVAGLIPYPNGGSYSITKFALNGFSKSLREELKDKGIKVTSVYPGATWTNSWEAMKDQLPESRLMLASDVAKAIFLQLSLSPNAVVEDIILRPQLGDL